MVINARKGLMKAKSIIITVVKYKTDFNKIKFC